MPGLRAKPFSSSESSVRDELTPASAPGLRTGVNEAMYSISAMLGSVSTHALGDFRDLAGEDEVKGVVGVCADRSIGDCTDNRFNRVAFGDVTTRRGASLLNSTPFSGLDRLLCELLIRWCIETLKCPRIFRVDAFEARV